MSNFDYCECANSCTDCGQPEWMCDDPVDEAETE